MYGDVSEINYYTLINKLSISDQLVVWSWILGQHVDIGTDITSPFRSDNNPDCTLKNYGDVVFFLDGADPTCHGYTCIHAVAHLIPCKLNRASRLIDAALYFNQPIKFNVSTIISNNKRNNHTNSNIEFKPFIYKGKPSFNKQGAEYWKKHFVTSKQLKRYNRGGKLYQVSHYYLNKYMFIPKDICFAYTFNSGVKIYQPNGDKKSKWINTSTKNDFWLTKRDSNRLLISKSQKDHLVAENIFVNFDIYSGINESIFSDELVNLLFKYDETWSLLDNDATGIKSSRKLKKEHGIIPYIFEEGNKDLAEYVSKCIKIPNQINLPIIKI